MTARAIAEAVDAFSSVRGYPTASKHMIVSQRPWNRGLAQRLNERFCDTWFADTTNINLHWGWPAYNPQFIFFPHYSDLIPAEIYNNFQCVIFHMTDLPFGRGGSPLQNLIARGYTRTKITALKCVKELDAGPIYCQRDLDLSGTAEEIFIRADRIIEDMIVEIATTNPTPSPQGEPGLKFTRRTPDHSSLAGETDLPTLHDRIRMVDAQGYPVAYLETNGLRLEFSRASLKVGHIVADVKITRVE